MNEIKAMNPVCPSALNQSIEELDAWLGTDGTEPLTLSQGESVMLVLHELKRLRALTASADSVDSAQDELEAFDTWMHSRLFASPPQSVKPYDAWQARASLASKVEQEPSEYQVRECIDICGVPTWQPWKCVSKQKHEEIRHYIDNGYHVYQTRLLYTAPSPQQAGKDALQECTDLAQKLLCQPPSEFREIDLIVALGWIRDRLKAMQASPAQTETPKCEKCGGSTCNVYGMPGTVCCNSCDHMQAEAQQSKGERE